MRILSIWIRRGSARFVAPFILGVLIFQISFLGMGWRYEWLVGFRTVVLPSPLISPLVAAAVAFDAARLWGPLVDTIGQQTKRSRRFVIITFATTVLWAFGVYALAFVVVTIVLWKNQAFGHPDPWVALELLAGLIGSAAIGLAIGTKVKNVVAAPLAAATVFLAIILGNAYLVLSALSTIGMQDTALGLTRSSTMALLSIGLNLTVAVVAWLVVLRPSNPSWRWTTAVATVSILLLAFIVQTRSAAHTTDEYVLQDSTMVCVGQAVTVCGPDSAASFFVEVSAELESKTALLADSGLSFATTYVYVVSGTIPDTSSAAVPLSGSPAWFARDPNGFLAAALARSGSCPQDYVGDNAMFSTVDAEYGVMIWIRSALESTDPGPAPEQIRSAAQTVSTCAGTR